ncbi:arsenical resistance protein ArsH [Thiotrichales bacterium 19S3-7]|nr:arsenical resistance protein ArsH [Thiotrichales bacterium 19S3-7]MCF6802897.1 arsenical resistance protein ArsH [Thiotrichales bacterium 19S3-11]
MLESASHPPKILMLYGSLRSKSYSRLAAEEAKRILESFGAEVKFFHPHDLPLADISIVQSKEHQHQLPEKVKELRQLVSWCEAMVWSSPEVHGAMSSVFKNQIDWLPLIIDSIRPTQGLTLALMQVSGGSQSFNAVNQMRILGRWMRMFTIPNQSSIAQAYKQFDENGIMLASTFRQRVVDVMEELFKFTLLLRGNANYLTQRYSENTPNEVKTIDNIKNVVSF